MSFTYLTNLPLEQAQRDYPLWLAEGGFAPKTERLPTARAAGRVTTRAVYASLCAPHYPACAMDGIAVVVNPANSINDLSVEQIKSIYTGETLAWSELQ